MVYVVLTSFDYEGNDIKAVFSTKKKADDYVAKLELMPYQRVTIEEWAIDHERH